MHRFEAEVYSCSAKFVAPFPGCSYRLPVTQTLSQTETFGTGKISASYGRSGLKKESSPGSQGLMIRVRYVALTPLTSQHSPGDIASQLPAGLKRLPSCGTTLTSTRLVPDFKPQATAADAHFHAKYATTSMFRSWPASICDDAR